MIDTSQYPFLESIFLIQQFCQWNNLILDNAILRVSAKIVADLTLLEITDEACGILITSKLKLSVLL